MVGVSIFLLLSMLLFMIEGEKESEILEATTGNQDDFYEAKRIESGKVGVDYPCIVLLASVALYHIVVTEMLNNLNND